MENEKLLKEVASNCKQLVSYILSFPDLSFYYSSVQ